MWVQVENDCLFLTNKRINCDLFFFLFILFLKRKFIMSIMLWLEISQIDFHHGTIFYFIKFFYLLNWRIVVFYHFHESVMSTNSLFYLLRMTLHRINIMYKLLLIQKYKIRWYFCLLICLICFIFKNHIKYKYNGRRIGFESMLELQVKVSII